jgi:cytochrome c-type biogenesis protein
VFASLGVVLEMVLASATMEVRAWLARLAGVVVVGFGLHLTGLVELSVFRNSGALSSTDGETGLVGSFLLGGTFAVGWTPCVGPVLGSAFALEAADQAAAFPVMVAYSLGFAAPSLLVSLVRRRRRAAVRPPPERARAARRGFGVVLLGLGVLILTRRLDLLGSAVYAGELL